MRKWIAPQIQIGYGVLITSNIICSYSKVSKSHHVVNITTWTNLTCADGEWVTIWKNIEKLSTTRDQDISDITSIRHDSVQSSYGQDSCQLPPKSSPGHSELKTFAESQAPINTAPKDSFSQYQPIPSPIISRGVGKTFAGDYYPGNTARNTHYEELDSTFFVRSPSFFQVGKVRSLFSWFRTQLLNWSRSSRSYLQRKRVQQRQISSAASQLSDLVFVYIRK